MESVKAASDIYAPISGEVVAVNQDLSSSPEKINEDAYAAWMFSLSPSDPARAGVAAECGRTTRSWLPRIALMTAAIRHLDRSRTDA